MTALEFLELFGGATKAGVSMLYILPACAQKQAFSCNSDE